MSKVPIFARFCKSYLPSTGFPPQKTNVKRRGENGMENVTEIYKRTYWANDIADLLDISPSTLRKWSLLLEAEGYHFIRDEHNRRAYTDYDLIALRKLKEFLNNKMSMENAIKAVSLLHSQKENDTPGTGIVTNDYKRLEERYHSLDQSFKEYVQQQQEFNKALLEQLKRQEEYIEQSIKERDRDLMQTLNGIIETNRIIAAAQEQREKKKWYQFWK
jgi:DNA-binding transcriptional MerR regulator